MKIVLKRKQKREEDFFMENNMNLVNNNALKFRKKSRGITLIALVITVVLNCLYLAMERMLKKVKILKKEKTSCII